MKTPNAFSPSYEVDLNANNRSSSYTAANPVSIHQKGGEGTDSSKTGENLEFLLDSRRALDFFRYCRAFFFFFSFFKHPRAALRRRRA